MKSRNGFFNLLFKRRNKFYAVHFAVQFFVIVFLCEFVFLIVECLGIAGCWFCFHRIYMCITYVSLNLFVRKKIHKTMIIIHQHLEISKQGPIPADRICLLLYNLNIDCILFDLYAITFSLLLPTDTVPVLKKSMLMFYYITTTTIIIIILIIIIIVFIIVYISIIISSSIIIPCYVFNLFKSKCS